MKARIELSKTKFLIIATVAALAVGVVLSLLYNSFFLFLFVPFGFGWIIRGKARKEDRTEKDPDREEVQEGQET